MIMGEFYYKYALRTLYKKVDKDEVQKVISIYKKKLETLKEKIGISNNYDTYEVKSLNDIENPKKGDIAVIKSNDEDDGNIYVYNTKWSFVKKDTSKTLKELCLFKGTDLDKIKIKDITSEYIEEQCKSRKQEYYKTEYQEILQNYNEVQILSDIGDIKNIIEDEYLIALKKLQLLNFKLQSKNNKGLKKNKEKNKSNKSNIYKQVYIANKIDSVNNKFYMKYFVYKLMELDGIYIDDIIYSKKYKMPLMCGHWKYLREFEYCSTLKDKNIIGNQLIDKFCSKENGFMYCKKCGELLDLVDYDEVDGFTKDGHLKVVREVIQNDKLLKTNNKIDLYLVVLQKIFEIYY